MSKRRSPEPLDFFIWTVEVGAFLSVFCFILPFFSLYTVLDFLSLLLYNKRQFLCVLSPLIVVQNNEISSSFTYFQLV